MYFRKEYRKSRKISGIDGEPYFKQHFWWPFGNKQKTRQAPLRPGALSPEAVKRQIKNFGVGAMVEILRIGYDGKIDDYPMMVQITDISEDGFSGKIVNAERELIEKGTEKLVFARMGGGHIDFNYNDGDIKEISRSSDVQTVSESRDVAGLSEILSALDVGDKIITSYFDKNQYGNVTTEGTLVSKDENNKKFTMKIEKINKIGLEKQIEKDFNIEEDLVMDISLV